MNVNHVVYMKRPVVYMLKHFRLKCFALETTRAGNIKRFRWIAPQLGPLLYLALQ